MIADTIAAELHGWRHESDALLTDTATITRGGGAPTFNPTTGTMTPAAGTVVHTGPCRLRQPSPDEAETLFGEQQVSIARFIAVFPHDVDGIQIGDVIAITASADPDVPASTYRVTAVPRATITIYKGFPCEAVTT